MSATLEFEAIAAIDFVEVAAERVAEATAAEMAIDDERPLVKADAIRRIMVRDNIAATPAEKIVETDAEFLGLRARQKAVVVEKIRAEGVLAAAKLRAQLRVRLVEVGV